MMKKLLIKFRTSKLIIKLYAYEDEIKGFYEIKVFHTSIRLIKWTSERKEKMLQTGYFVNLALHLKPAKNKCCFFTLIFSPMHINLIFDFQRLESFLQYH